MLAGWLPHSVAGGGSLCVDTQHCRAAQEQAACHQLMHGQAACHQTPTGARAWAREGLVDRLCAAAPHLFHRDGVLGGRRCQRGGEAHGQDSAGGEHDRSVTHGTANRRRGWVSGGGGGKAAQAQDNGCKPEEGLGERRRRRRGGEAARRRTTGAVVQGPGSTWQHAQPRRGAHTQRMCHLPCAGNTAAAWGLQRAGERPKGERGAHNTSGGAGHSAQVGFSVGGSAKQEGP